MVMTPVEGLHQCLCTASRTDRLSGSYIGDALPRKNKRGLALLPRTEDRIGPRFRLPSMDRRHPPSVGMGGAFFRAFVPAAKALSGAYEEGDRGHAHHHQRLARGIRADTFGRL